jgi:cytidylate kinase
MSLITISRTIGCGCGEIGRDVAGGLGLELYDDERFRKEAVELGISNEEAARLDEKRPGFFDRLFNHRPYLYRELMESVVYEIAGRGSGVIVGHASQVLLHDFDCAFHVLCSCPETSRIRRVAEKSGISGERAEEIIRKADRERDDFLRTVYHLYWKDPALYDLVINTEKLGEEYAARLIIAAVRERITECGLDSLSAMARLSLKKKARAALIDESFNINLLFLDVPGEGEIYIRGLASTLEEAGKIKSVLEGLDGVLRVVSDISVY